MTFFEDGLANRGPALAVMERFVVGEEGNWFLVMGGLEFFCHGLLSWFSRQDESHGRLAVCSCIRSVRSRSSTKFQHYVMCVVLRQSRKMGHFRLMSSTKGLILIGHCRCRWVTSVPCPDLGSMAATVSGSLL